MSFLRQVAYNVLFIAAFAVAWPYFAWRLRKRGHLWRDFWQRLGLYGKSLRRSFSPGVDLWIHAVSVGEVMLASVLLRQMRETRPELRVALSTTTQTGHRLARKLTDKDDKTFVFYNPTDFLWSVILAFDAIRPKMLILVESEIWPNYLWCAKRRGIPVCLLNARLSPRTEARYRLLRYFCRPVLSLVDLVFAQHPTDIERLIAAGFPSESIFPVGSLKYEVADLPDDSDPASLWWPKIGWEKEKLVLLGGSTHAGEEAILARIYKKLLDEFPDLRLVIAPRHAERGNSIRDLCEDLGLTVRLRSELDEASFIFPPQVLVLNTTGELRSAYRQADIVFIGKSLRAKGGQNFIEAARVGVPVIVGPNMQNFSFLAVEFLSKGGLIQVLDEFALAQRLRELAGSAERRAELGRRAQEIFSTNLGAGKTSARIIDGYLDQLTPLAK